MVGVAIVNMVTVILILILERTQMIGILKSLGMNGQALRKIFVYNAGWFIALGMIIGNLTGLGILAVEDQFHLMNISPETYYISKVPIAFTWGYFALINAGTFLVCILSMVVPSIIVGRVLPAKALRFT